MDEKVKDPVMYCLNYRNCLGDKRKYYVAEREVVEAIKRRVDELSENEVNEAGCREAVFPEHSEARVVYNLKWEDSLEFIAKDKETAVSCAEEMGFRGLFPKLERQN